MLTDYQCCQFAAATYDQTAQWDHMWQGDSNDNFYVCHKELDNFDIIACRGSIILADWIHDIEAFPYLYEPFGFVHSGFFAGAIKAYTNIKPFIKKPIVLTGHSLGAAHAQLLAGMFLLDNMEVSKVCTMGSPRVGFNKFVDVVKSIVNYKIYKNGPDYVTDVPLNLPISPFVHARDLLLLNVIPTDNDISLFAFHNISLYLEGTQNAVIA